MSQRLSGRPEIPVAIREECGRLIIRRDSERDCTFRIIKVSVDEKSAGIVNFGETLKLDVPAGLHTVTVDNTWTSRTITISCEPEESVEVMTGNTAGGCFLTMLFVIGMCPMGIFLESRSDVKN